MSEKLEHSPLPFTWADRPGAGIEIYATLPKGFKFDCAGFGADGIRSFMTHVMTGAHPIPIASERWVQFETAEWNAMQAANAAYLVRAANNFEAVLKALSHLVADCAPYEAWQRPCLAYDNACAAIAAAKEP